MKKLNIKGFSAVEGLLLVIIVTLVAGVGYYVYQQSQKQDETSKPQSSATSQQLDYQNPPKSDLVTELPDGERIQMIKPGDETKLPDDVPASFKEYMKAELAKNSEPRDGCYISYSVGKYSSLNIGGGTGSVVNLEGETSDDTCFGGAAAYWYLKDGKWYLHGTQSIDTCKKIASTTIYEEFIPTCLNDNSKNLDDVVKNPNGSIDNAIKEQ